MNRFYYRDSGKMDNDGKKFPGWRGERSRSSDMGRGDACCSASFKHEGNCILTTKESTEVFPALGMAKAISCPKFKTLQFI